MEWIRYMGKEMLPRYTTNEPENIFRRRGEKCKEKMMTAELRKAKVH